MKTDGEMYSGTVVRIEPDGFELDLAGIGSVWVSDEPDLIEIGSDVTVYLTGEKDSDGDPVVLFLVGSERVIH